MSFKMSALMDKESLGTQSHCSTCSIDIVSFVE